MYKHTTLSICDVALTPLAIFLAEAFKVVASDPELSGRTKVATDVSAPATLEIVLKIDDEPASLVTGFSPSISFVN
jgi:hypothetical protein